MANVESSARAVRNELERPIAAAEMIAENTLIKDWLERDESEFNVERITRYLSSVRDWVGADSAHLVSVGSEKYYTHEGIDRVVDRSNDPWFYSFLDSGRERSLTLDVDQRTGELNLFINTRMSRGGDALAVGGVGGVGIRMEALSRLISEFRFAETGIVYLVNQDGRVQIHPDLERTGDSLADVTSGEAAQTLLSSDDYTMTEFTRSGTDYITATEPMPELGWRLVAEVPRQQVYGALGDAIMQSILAGLVVAVLFLIGIAWFAARMTQPLERVTRMLKAIGEGGGDLTQRLDVESRDEIGQLYDGFNRFMASQQDMVGGILKTANQLGDGVSSISQEVDRNANRASEQNQLTDSVATAINEMEATVNEISGNANNTATELDEVGNRAQEIRTDMDTSVQQIESMASEIRASSEAINQLAARALAVACLVISLQAEAYNWSDTYIGYRYGTELREPANPHEIEKHILTLNHVSGYEYGQNFFNLDILQSNSQDPAAGTNGPHEGATKFYLTYRHQLPFGKLFGLPLSFCPVHRPSTCSGTPEPERR